MTLNIDLEDVPDAILEAVKARIMANRRRLLDREELLRQPPLQPKPQFRKFGADSKTWKRPQPAAVPSGQTLAFGGLFTTKNDSQDIDGVAYSLNGQQSVELLERFRDFQQAPSVFDFISGVYFNSNGILVQAPNEQTPTVFSMPFEVASSNVPFVDGQTVIFVGEIQTFGVLPSGERPAFYNGTTGTGFLNQAELIWRLPAGGQSFVLVQARTYYNSNKLYYVTYPTGFVSFQPAFNVAWDILQVGTVETKCVFVGPSVIKEVPVPSGVSNALNTLFPAYANQSVTRSTNLEARIVRTPPFNGRYSVFQSNLGTVSVTYNFPSRPFVSSGGVTQHYGSLDSSITTPGVFTLFKNPSLAQDQNAPATMEEAYDVIDPEFRNVQFITTQGDDLTTKGIYYITSRNADPSAIGGSQRARATVPPAIQAGGSSVPVSSLVTDMGNPGYCRRQLLDLGFSLQHITP